MSVHEIIIWVMAVFAVLGAALVFLGIRKTQNSAKAKEA